MVYSLSNAPSCIVQYTSESVDIRLFVQPNAKKNECVGMYGDALRIRVQSPAVENKANDAILVFLAKLFSIKRRQIELLFGTTSRTKIVRITADVEQVVACVTTLYL